MSYRAFGCRIAVAAFAIVLLTAAAAHAQVGRVSGFVKDETGQPIKGATVRADNPDAPLKSITASTDEKGRFYILGLIRGDWTVTADAPGFQRQFVDIKIERVS